MSLAPDRDALLELVRSVVADVMYVPPSRITAQTNLVEDLEADSLTLVGVVEGLEARLHQDGYDIEIGDDELDRLYTVQDTVEYLLSALGAAPTSTPSSDGAA